MSQIFHKSCYTSRSSGYKYRTLSTNTGDRKRRDSKEENAFDWNLRELKRAILSRIDKELEQTQHAREAIKLRFFKVDAKVNSMLELQKTVVGLRKDLCSIENRLAVMVEKVDKLDMLTAAPDVYSPRDSTLRQSVIFEEPQTFSSAVTKHNLT